MENVTLLLFNTAQQLKFLVVVELFIALFSKGGKKLIFEEYKSIESTSSFQFDLCFWVHTKETPWFEYRHIAVICSEIKYQIYSF